jgi:hypothetical protein
MLEIPKNLLVRIVAHGSLAEQPAQSLHTPLSN